MLRNKILKTTGNKSKIFLAASDTQTFVSESGNIALPTTQENDILVLIGGHGNDLTTSFGSGVASGWTSIINDDYINITYGFYYKRMGATPDTTLDVKAFTSAGTSCSGSYVLMAFRGVDTTTALDVTSVYDDELSIAINSESITTVTNFALVVSGGIIRDTVSSSEPPNGYTLGGTEAGTNYRVSAAYKTKFLAGAENPSAFSPETDNRTSKRTAHVTLALRPD